MVFGMTHQQKTTWWLKCSATLDQLLVLTDTEAEAANTTTGTAVTKPKTKVQVEEKPKRKITKPSYLNHYF